MPYIFSTRYEYKENNYQLNMQDAINKFPFLANKIISGEILAVYIDNKLTTIRKPFKCKIVQITQHPYWIGILTELNPLKEMGIPPCDVCVVLYKYEEKEGERNFELPIMENEIVRGSIWSYFDEITKKLAKEEEIRIILETTTFHPEVKQLVGTLREAYISFEEERFGDTKTACRKIIENLRNKVPKWKAIDGSESICEKFKSVLNSMYSFASPGGPHEGKNTKEETEFILKSVAGLFFYVNSLLKSNRIELKSSQIK